ncbi:MAG: GntR family transcriptional regulator [Betaproteobacteria bacterium]|nr:GntR family transcriptional regulator [Betaproteobacteria bacterium]
MKTVSPRRPSLQEVAYTRLRDAIRDGMLEPNARLRETEIASWLKMSRTPVRDALRRLTVEGLLAPKENRGVVVAALDYQAVSELYSMREALDGTAAAMAARRVSPAEVAALQDIIQAETLTKSPRLLQQINRRFHKALYQSAHNRFLLRSASTIDDVLFLLDQATYEAAFRTTTLSNPDRPETAHREHVRIVKAIEEGDEHLAEEAARAHVRSAHRERLRVMHEAVRHATEATGTLK